MDVRTKEHSFSPYRYHEYTRDVAEARREKETEAAREKRDEGSATGADSAKFKGATQAKGPRPAPPIMGLKRQNKPDWGSEKIEAPKSGNASSDLWLGRPGSMRGSYDGSGGVGSGGYKSVGLVSGPGEPSKVGLHMVTASPVSTEEKGLNLKTPVASKESKRKGREVTEKSAGAIRDFLKLHCMRTRNDEETVDFLYGRNQEKEIYFDLYGCSPSSEERIEEALAHLKFEDVLRYVFLPSMQLEKKSISSRFPQTSVKPPDGKGRSDMAFFFKFLRNKGVKRIIRVIVDDTLIEPAHSDDAIEKALEGLGVEIWDWQKFDLCTETIRTAAPDAREVSLYWSGNNAVLRGWSEPEGLKLLKNLEKVNLHVEQGLETAKRTHSNVCSFIERLPDIKVDIVKERQPDKHHLMVGPVGITREQSEHRHKWLTCTDEFADFIQNVDPPRELPEPVTIALIDDGVDINEQSLHGKIIGGRSFGLRNSFEKLSKPYYVSSGGHGTVMASLICRVCPKTQLYVLKLDEHLSEHSTRQITAESAAKAVRAAIDKKVHIISMSWTIERTPQNESSIRELEFAVEAAAKAGILMLCAASDQGASRDNSFPACGGTKNLFKIGAAAATGRVWKWVGDSNDVDFIFPGHNIVKERPKDAPMDKCQTLTGSSVATAIATGLAALVLYCVQLGAVNTQVSNQQHGQGGNIVTMEDFRAMKGHARMKEAFSAIGTSQASGNKYIEVWNLFEPAAKHAEGVEMERKVAIVTELAQMLKPKKIFE